MKDATFFHVYLVTFLICLGITIVLLLFISKGLKKFFDYLCEDSEVAKFFLKLTSIIILLGGVSAGLKSDYKTDKDANWLTLSWDAARQLKETFGQLLVLLTLFAIVFFIIQLIAKRLNK